MSVMFFQICNDYPSLPDVRTLTIGEVRMFYDAIRGKLRELTKPVEVKK